MTEPIVLLLLLLLHSFIFFCVKTGKHTPKSIYKENIIINDLCEWCIARESVHRSQSKEEKKKKIHNFLDPVSTKYTFITYFSVHRTKMPFHHSSYIFNCAYFVVGVIRWRRKKKIYLQRKYWFFWISFFFRFAFCSIMSWEIKFI